MHDDNRNKELEEFPEAPTLEATDESDPAAWEDEETGFVPADEWDASMQVMEDGDFPADGDYIEGEVL